MEPKLLDCLPSASNIYQIKNCLHGKNRINKMRILFVLLFVSLSMCSFATINKIQAKEARCLTLKSKVPEYFVGYFVWRGGRSPQVISLVQKKATCLTDEVVSITGKARYQVKKYKKDLRYQMVINLKSNSFQMLEIIDNPPRSWDLSSVFKGKISDDFMRISAKWKSKKYPISGDLVLIGHFRSRAL